MMDHRISRRKRLLLSIIPLLLFVMTAAGVLLQLFGGSISVFSVLALAGMASYAYILTRQMHTGREARGDSSALKRRLVLSLIVVAGIISVPIGFSVGPQWGYAAGIVTIAILVCLGILWLIDSSQNEVS